MDSLATALLGAAGLALTAIALAVVLALFKPTFRDRLIQFLFEAPSSASDPAKPSVSRLQMLVWNFVVAFAFLFVLAKSMASGGQMPLREALEALFSTPVLVLLGISNGTYLAGKFTGGQAPGATNGETTAAGAVLGVPPASATPSVPPVG